MLATAWLQSKLVSCSCRYNHETQSCRHVASYGWCVSQDQIASAIVWQPTRRNNDTQWGYETALSTIHGARLGPAVHMHLWKILLSEAVCVSTREQPATGLLTGQMSRNVHVFNKHTAAHHSYGKRKNRWRAHLLNGDSPQMSLLIKELPRHRTHDCNEPTHCKYWPKLRR